MQNNESMPRPEIIAVADTVAREKNIDREDVFTAMEVAIQKAGRSRYGFEHDIRAHIDRKTGAISLARYREVVDEVENEVTQLTVDQARDYDENAKVGDFIIDALPPIDFGRIAAQTAKQVIVQKVRDAERNRQFEEYKEKIGTIVNGTVKRIEFGNVILDIGKTEAVLRRDEIIPREKFKNGDRVRAYVLDVRRETKGPQIFLSRTCPEFMAKLFASEVPEIYDGIVKIVAVARDPGSKAKIAVKTDDMTIDAVGACVGLRGIRVQAVVTELQGEKIDIVPYSEDKAQYIVSALAPAEVTKVVLDEENNRIEVVVPQEQFSVANSGNFPIGDFSARLLLERDGQTLAIQPEVHLSGGESADEVEENLDYYMFPESTKMELERLGHLRYYPWIKFSIPNGADGLWGYLAYTVFDRDRFPEPADIHTDDPEAWSYGDFWYVFLRHQVQWLHYPFVSIDAYGGTRSALTTGPIRAVWAPFDYYPPA